MKEILAWGNDFPAQLDRLGIEANQVYIGAGTVPSIYEVSEADFDRLCGDDEENWEEVDAGWRYAQGCNLDLTESKRKWILVNHRNMKGWRCPDHSGPRQFDTLLQYMEYELGATQPRNVAAIAAGLASLNGCSIAELFGRYQPVAVEVQQGEAQAGG